MPVELRPLGVNCNIACQYCYQNPIRDAGNVPRDYDLEAMKAAVEQIGKPPALFGGEPLLLPLDDLEDLMAWTFAKWGRNTLQTNGVLITEEHIRLFKQYNAHLGVSIDGPADLNDVRWAGTVERTRESTAKTEAALARLREENIPVSVIITLHRGNATPEKLPRLKDWIRALAKLGVRKVRLHVLEVENPFVRAKYALDNDENLHALLSLAELTDELSPKFLDVFRDMGHLLDGDDHRTACVWRACDPYTTAAVQGVEGHGQRSNCGRTNKDGIDFVKTRRPGYERYLALYHTPQEHNGCAGCRFFLMCKGHCPGTAEDGDWRNRTEHCGLWMKLYEHFEAQAVAAGKTPLSLHPEREAVEQRFLAMWAAGRNPTLRQVIEELGIELAADTVPEPVQAAAPTT